MAANPLDPLIPKSLTDSVKEAFQIQASTSVEIVNVATVESQTLSGVDVISAIGLKSSAVTGSLALCFPSQCLLGVINKMLGESYKEITAENCDAAGELLNIIYASARVKMNQGGHDFAPAIPTTTRGAGIQISHGGGGKVVRIECQCSYGKFFLDVSLRRTAQ